MIVAGMPNVGKSTIINRLRAIGTSVGGKAVRTGGLPGITRAVSEFVRISPFPNIYMLDTPGVLMPKIVDPEIGLKIGLTGGMIDRVVGEYVLAEYLLHVLNSSPGHQKRYQEYFVLEEPVQRLEQLLPLVAQKTGQMKSDTMNLTNTISVLLKLFRRGELGRATLDQIPS
jgi:ribosome biogenesis GTPase A